MNVNDEKIKQDWAEIDSNDLKQALYHLERCEMCVEEYLADAVASLCGVSVNDMMSDSATQHFTHTRWLYWYAYRYMTGESFLKISTVLRDGWKRFTKYAVIKGVEKMSQMIESEQVWNKRWAVVKRIIKLREQGNEYIDNTIVVQVPRDIKNKINIVIKTK